MMGFQPAGPKGNVRNLGHDPARPGWLPSEAGRARPSGVSGPRFEFCGVRVDGDDGPIIEGFSAEIAAVGLTAMVGPSGAGKTTLLRLLNRLDDPDGGAVLFEGS